MNVEDDYEAGPSDGGAEQVHVWGRVAVGRADEGREPLSELTKARTTRETGRRNQSGEGR